MESGAIRYRIAILNRYMKLLLVWFDGDRDVNCIASSSVEWRRKIQMHGEFLRIWAEGIIRGRAKGELKKKPNRTNSKCVFYVLLTVHTCIILQISPTRCTVLFSIFISHLYMFRASTCPSSGKNYSNNATLVFVTLKGGSFKLQGYYYKKYRVLPIGKG